MSFNTKSYFGVPQNHDDNSFSKIFKIGIWMNGVITWVKDRCMDSKLVYGFLKLQSILNAKDRRGPCQEYIEKWLMESQRDVYLGAYLN